MSALLHLSCSTILLSSNSSNLFPFKPDDDATVILNDDLDDVLSQKMPDCLTLVTTLEDLHNVADKILRSRMEVKLLIIPGGNSTVNSDAIKINRKHNIPIHVMQPNAPEPVEAVSATDRSLNVGYALAPPYAMKKSDSGLLYGVDFDIVGVVEEELGLDVTFIQAKHFGDLLSRTGAKEIDMALNQLNFDILRLRLGLEVSPALQYRKFHVQARYPVPVVYFDTLSRPFSALVWSATLAAIASVLATLIIIRRFTTQKKSLFHFDDAFVVLSPLINSSIPFHQLEMRRRPPQRVMLAFWFLLGSVICYAFKSNLLSSLVEKDFEQFPETLQNVLDMKKEVYMFKHPAFIRQFTESPVERYRRVYDEGVLQRGSFYPTPVFPQETIDDILSGKGVVIWAEDFMDPYLHLMRAGSEELNMGGYGGYFSQLKLRLKPKIDAVLARMLEGGILEKLMSRHKWDLSWKQREMLRSTSSIARETTISALHVTPVLALSAAGLVLAALVFVWERTVVRKRALAAEEDDSVWK